MNDSKSNTPVNEKDQAQTPIWFINSMQNLLGQQFALDVCADPETAKCENYYSPKNNQDGLSLPWSRLNWCNPPFSDISPWIHKARFEAALGNHSVLIFPDTPETEYSRLAAEHADTLIRMPFRLKFLRPNGDPFRDDKGRIQSPKFPVVAALFTPIGLQAPTRQIYNDFRVGYLYD